MLPAIDDIDTISPSPDALSSEAKVRMVANWPRQLTANIRSIRSSSSAIEIAMRHGLGKAGGVDEHVESTVAALDLDAQRRQRRGLRDIRNERDVPLARQGAAPRPCRGRFLRQVTMR